MPSSEFTWLHLENVSPDISDEQFTEEVNKKLHKTEPLEANAVSAILWRAVYLGETSFEAEEVLKLIKTLAVLDNSLIRILSEGTPGSMTTFAEELNAIIETRAKDWVDKHLALFGADYKSHETNRN